MSINTFWDSNYHTLADKTTFQAQDDFMTTTEKEEK